MNICILSPFFILYNGDCNSDEYPYIIWHVSYTRKEKNIPLGTI